MTEESQVGQAGVYILLGEVRPCCGKERLLPGKQRPVIVKAAKGFVNQNRSPGPPDRGLIMGQRTTRLVKEDVITDLTNKNKPDCFYD